MLAESLADCRRRIFGSGCARRAVRAPRSPLLRCVTWSPRLSWTAPKRKCCCCCWTKISFSFLPSACCKTFVLFTNSLSAELFWQPLTFTAWMLSSGWAKKMNNIFPFFRLVYEQQYPCVMTFWRFSVRDEVLVRTHASTHARVFKSQLRSVRAKKKYERNLCVAK